MSSVSGIARLLNRCYTVTLLADEVASKMTSVHRRRASPTASRAHPVLVPRCAGALAAAPARHCQKISGPGLAGRPVGGGVVGHISAAWEPFYAESFAGTPMNTAARVWR